MGTMLDCINRIPSIINNILDTRDKNYKELIEVLSKREEKIDELVFIASGTSYNSAFVAKNFIEDIAGIRVTLRYPNFFINYNKILNKNALYIIISQGGSTKVSFDSVNMLREKGYLVATITGSIESIIAKAGDIKIDMMCGKEEYLWRTIGYSSSVVNNYLIGLEIAKLYSKIDEEIYNKHIDMLRAIPNNHSNLVNKTLSWYEQNKEVLINNKLVMLTGADELWPVAQEADIKLMETITCLTKSCELEESIHGPQNAFKKEMTIFILLDKSKDCDKALSIAEFCKKEAATCFIVGDKVLDDRDLQVEIVGESFKALEYITPFQVLCYLISCDIGRDLTTPIYPQLTKYINKTL